MADTGYIHTFAPAEQDRLVAQAEFLEPYIFPTMDFSACRDVLEVGCGVGAEMEILLRRFPSLRVTGVDFSAAQLTRARGYLHARLAAGRARLQQGSAYELPFADRAFDGVCLIWVLEHLAAPQRALTEAARVLRPGGVLSGTEVCNASWQVEPRCPAMTEYWAAFNALQRELGGDPDVGGKLPALLTAAGLVDVQAWPVPVRLDGRMRDPAARRKFLGYWETLWLTGAGQLLARGWVTADLVAAVRREFAGLAANPAAVYHYAAWQVRGFSRRLQLPGHGLEFRIPFAAPSGTLPAHAQPDDDRNAANGLCDGAHGV